MKWAVLVIMVLMVVLALSGCQPMSISDVSLEEFLLHMMTGPGIGLAISVVLEYFPFAKRYFDKIQDLEWKRMAVLVACLIFPILALLAAWQLGYTALNEITVWTVLTAAWEAFTTSTILHGFIRRKQPMLA